MLNIVISAQSFSLQTLGLSVHSPSSSTYCGGGGGERKLKHKMLEIDILAGSKHNRVPKFKISWRLVIRNPVKIDPVLHPGAGFLSDIWVWKCFGNGWDPSGMLWRCTISNFFEIGHQEPHQDDPCPPSWSWILEWHMGLEMPLTYSGSTRNIMEMLYFKFHGDWSSGTPSRWPPSSILELEFWWWWVKTEGGWVIRISLVTVLVD